VNFHIEDEAIDDSTHVIELGGEVDLYTAPEFKERMVELIESGKKQIVVDLSKATFIDSTTLGDHRTRPGLPDPLVARGRIDGPLHRRLISRLALLGPLAQLAEQETLNLKVEGSIPSRPIRPRSAHSQ
jgi:hypothetical protein